MVITGTFFPFFAVSGFIKDMFCLKNPITRYTQYKKNRGMSIIYDWIDWLGGYPFEVARPEVVVDFYKKSGFRLLKSRTTKGWGNNQFVFRKKIS